MADRSIAYHLCRIVVVISLLLPVWAHAQSAPLYLVELLVFSHPSGAGAEQWDATPELSYPKTSRFLTYPGEQPVAPASSPATSPAPGTAEPMGIDALPGPVQPDFFTTLPQSQQQLAGKAAAMQRSGRYRILFHEAWLQPVYSQAESVPLVLDRSGDGGAWPPLQGSIKLYLARYVYLETNLWLNTQGEYLPGTWRMPAPPLAPVSKPPAGVLPAPLQPAGQPAVAGMQTPAMNTASGNGEIGIGENLGPDYPYRHAVLLQQTRRVPSGEIVYVDHPLLGVLVQVSPLESATPSPVESATPTPVESATPAPVAPAPPAPVE
jgi:hypothetical protein